MKLRVSPAQTHTATWRPSSRVGMSGHTESGPCLAFERPKVTFVVCQQKSESSSHTETSGGKSAKALKRIALEAASQLCAAQQAGRERYAEELLVTFASNLRRRHLRILGEQVNTAPVRSQTRLQPIKSFKARRTCSQSRVRNKFKRATRLAKEV